MHLYVLCSFFGNFWMWSFSQFVDVFMLDTWRLVDSWRTPVMKMLISDLPSCTRCYYSVCELCSLLWVMFNRSCYSRWYISGDEVSADQLLVLHVQFRSPDSDGNRGAFDEYGADNYSFHITQNQMYGHELGIMTAHQDGHDFGIYWFPQCSRYYYKM